MIHERPPSALSAIQPESWPAEYTTELLNVLHVLGRLVALEPEQAKLLTEICAANTIDAATLKAAGALDVSEAWRKKLAGVGSPSLFAADGEA